MIWIIGAYLLIGVLLAIYWDVSAIDLIVIMFLWPLVLLLVLIFGTEGGQT